MTVSGEIRPPGQEGAAVEDAPPAAHGRRESHARAAAFLWPGVLPATALLLAAYYRWLPIDLTEALGFVTGAACVALVVREHIWNFPIGIANNAFFLVLFWGSRLYADALLQVVYMVLAALGWHQWLRGGDRQAPLRIRSAAPRVLLAAVGAVVVLTGLMTVALQMARGAAPGLDAVTTALSLAAQYLLNRKYLQNWWFWIVADVLYIYLYTARGLYLTALLYAVFLVMCLIGYRRWTRVLQEAVDG